MAKTATLEIVETIRPREVRKVTETTELELELLILLQDSSEETKTVREMLLGISRPDTEMTKTETIGPDQEDDREIETEKTEIETIRGTTAETAGDVD